MGQTINDYQCPKWRATMRQPSVKNAIQENEITNTIHKIKDNKDEAQYEEYVLTNSDVLENWTAKESTLECLNIKKLVLR